MYTVQPVLENRISAYKRNHVYHCFAGSIEVLEQLPDDAVYSDETSEKNHSDCDDVAVQRGTVLLGCSGSSCYIVDSAIVHILRHCAETGVEQCNGGGSKRVKHNNTEL